MSVVDAVQGELDALPGVLSEGAFAATALALAAELDEPGNSATSKSMCARVLTETLEKLRAQAAEVKPGKVSKLDELRARRAGHGT
jgi:hypothetical protein